MPHSLLEFFLLMFSKKLFVWSKGKLSMTKWQTGVDWDPRRASVRLKMPQASGTEELYWAYFLDGATAHICFRVWFERTLLVISFLQYYQSLHTAAIIALCQ